MQTTKTAFCSTLLLMLLVNATPADEPKGKANPFKQSEARTPSRAVSFVEKPTAEQLKFFEAKIRPVLIAECYQCHSAETEKIKGGLTLDTRAGMHLGGDTGAVIVPGSPQKSPLIELLTTKNDDRHMPPKKNLPEAVIADLRTWVEMGAPDPRDGVAKVAKHEIDVEKGRQFWAFQLPRAVPPAATTNTRWAITETDKYVLAGLEAKGLKPVADVDPQTLLRRLSLDLIGLPPTVSDTDAFATAYTANPRQALEQITDRLLANPGFGERWGRHWLDVARYGESTGKSVNHNYPHAWRYRDYVIAAFNADKPFDEFVREQLAGDLIKSRDANDQAENAVATGFLAFGTKNLNERSRAQFEMDVIDEQIDATTQAFLGMTAACARCHDHKFDPIPMKDYYALAGIFRSTETCYGTINAIQSRYASPLLKLPASATVTDGTPPLSARERDTLTKELKQLKDEIAEMAKKDVRDTFLSQGGVRRRIQIAMMEAKLEMYESDGQPKKQAMGVRERFRTRNSPLYQRGEVEKPGTEVARGLLQVVSTQQPKIQSGSGRSELANWIASTNNPLTARVYVNRIWLHLFGRGLVATPDNFGTTGSAPSKLALLDHLALEFMKNGWSTKKLIKQLVLSHSYQLSTQFHAANFGADPENSLLWRMTPGRLDAETIRDAMLAVSGQLERKPPQGSVVSRGGEGYAAAAQRNNFYGSRPDETHRSVYLPIIRDNLPESLTLFDAADPSLVVGDRANTTVPAQALYLMNNPFVIKQAEATAERLAKWTNDKDRIQEAYRLVFSRSATAQELESAESFLTKYSVGKKSQRDATIALCQALLGSAEFLMRN